MAKFLFMLMLIVWTDFSLAKLRFACPLNHFCLPRESCQKENVYVGHRANAKEVVPAEIKFMCGKLISSEGHVCCSSQDRLPEKFEPTPDNWYYGQSDTDLEDDILSTQVVPWPGHGTKALSPDNAVPPTLDLVPDEVVPLPAGMKMLCPANSFCISPFLCPMIDIVYSTYGLQEAEDPKYDCGTFIDTEGYVCCKGEVVTTAMYSYVLKDEEENSSTFVVSKMGKSFLRIFRQSDDKKLLKYSLTMKRKDESKADSATAEESADGSIIEGGKARRRRSANEGVYSN